MRSGLVAFSAVFFVFQFIRGFFVDTSFVVLHFAFLANQINVGVFSARHNIKIIDYRFEIIV